MEEELSKDVSVRVFPLSVDLLSNECVISLDSRMMELLIQKWKARPTQRAADGSLREPTIIKSFPMRDAYPAGHKPRRR